MASTGTSQRRPFAEISTQYPTASSDETPRTVTSRESARERRRARQQTPMVEKLCHHHR